jgi:hypothetical protein
VEIGGKSAEELIKELEEANIKLSDTAKFMLKSREFTPGDNREEATLIRLSVADLGFPKGANTTKIFERAKALGLELCPSDTGPNYRLQYQNQPMNEWFRIGMEPIVDSDGSPDVFNLARNSDGLWLGSRWAGPDDEWDPGLQLAFRFRKKPEQKENDED